jgi:hypothetical protein
MTNQHIKVTPVRRAQIDIGKLVAGLLLLVQERAERDEDDGTESEEPAA